MLPLFCRFTLNTTTAERGKSLHTTALLLSLHPPPSTSWHTFHKTVVPCKLLLLFPLLLPHSLLISLSLCERSSPPDIQPPTTTNVSHLLSSKQNTARLCAPSLSPLPRCQQCLGCRSCSRTTVWCSCWQPRCSFQEPGPLQPSPPIQESAQQNTEGNRHTSDYTATVCTTP